MFKKILIANRGEIAVRIIRCCKEMGIEAVAVYSSADATSLHVQLADEAYCIGPAKSSESYLNMENILSVATLSGCDAIHPGFGYLSENSTFARLVEKCGMTFIGPSGDVIDQMGNNWNSCFDHHLSKQEFQLFLEVMAVLNLSVKEKKLLERLVIRF